LTDLLASLGRNKGLKLLALLLAVTLWLSVGGEERTEATLNVALELTNLPHHLMVTSEVPPAVQVRVMGPRSFIRNLSQSRLTYSLDLSSFKRGSHAIPLRPANLPFMRGVTVVRIQPNPLNLTLVPTMTQTLSIKPVLEGRPPKGYEVVSVHTRPEEVTVVGPSGELADLQFIQTMPIDLGDLTASATVPTDLDFKNLHLTVKEHVPILADISVAAKELTRIISGVLVVPGPQPARLKPSQVTLTLKGPWPQLKDLKPEDLQAMVDTRNLKAGRHRLRVTVHLPSGLNLQGLKPETVTAEVRKAPR
jgi:YbbR domain-containing protein